MVDGKPELEPDVFWFPMSFGFQGFGCAYNWIGIYVSFALHINPMHEKLSFNVVSTKCIYV